jgi:hypothetical protein
LAEVNKHWLIKLQEDEEEKKKKRSCDLWQIGTVALDLKGETGDLRRG